MHSAVLKIMTDYLLKYKTLIHFKLIHKNYNIFKSTLLEYLSKGYTHIKYSHMTVGKTYLLFTKPS